MYARIRYFNGSRSSCLSMHVNDKQLIDNWYKRCLANTELSIVHEDLQYALTLNYAMHFNLETCFNVYVSN